MVFIALVARERSLRTVKLVKDYRGAAFIMSALLLVQGFIFGAFIRGADLRVPGHYHATIGAVSLAEEFTGFVEFSPKAVGAFLDDYRKRHEKRNRFFLMLNRMLLLRKDPEQSYRLLERFYNMPESLIQNFYADRMTTTDRMRLMMGRPPLPITEALKLILRGSPGPEGESAPVSSV